MSVEDDQALRERIERQIAMLGKGSLNSLDAWRMKGFELDDRMKAKRRVEALEQQRAAAATAADEVAELRAKHERLRATHNENIATYNHNFGVLNKALDDADERAAQQDERADKQDATINDLRSEIAALKTELAEARVKDLDTLHSNLVRSAESSMRSFEQAAQRAEMSASEWDQVIEAGAKTTELMAEIRRMHEAKKNFRFRRELDQDNAITDLPSDYFLPPPRRH